MFILVGNWWTFVLRGLLAVLFGVLTFVLPEVTLLTLVWLFGFFAIVDGIFNLLAAFRSSGGAEQAPRWARVLAGLAGIIAGLLAVFVPGLTALALLFIIATWAMVIGVFEIAAAIRLRKQMRGEWMLGLAGAISILFGVLLAAFPGAGALAMVFWIGAFTIVFGISLIALGIRLRRHVRTTEQAADGIAAPVH